PHILAVHDSGEAAGFLYYVTPYVEGASLRDRLLRDRQLPLEQALQITREVADALDYAHQRGVIHRDIKPENILLQAGHAVVADFGIARAISAAGGNETRRTALTQPGMPIGTPDYMSPEQALAEPELDGRSDQYALACVLFEMLSGRPPFTGTSGESILLRHLTVEAPRVTDLAPGVPKRAAAARRVSPSRWRAVWERVGGTRTGSLGWSSPRSPIPSWSRTTWPTRWACGATASAPPGTRCSRRCAIGKRCSCWTTASIWSRRAPAWRRRCCAAARGCASWPRAARRWGSAASAPGWCQRWRFPPSRPASPSPARWRPRARRSACSWSGPRRCGRRSSCGRTTSRRSRTSAGASTACRWPSSWPPRGRAC